MLSSGYKSSKGPILVFPVLHITHKYLGENVEAFYKTKQYIGNTHKNDKRKWHVVKRKHYSLGTENYY